MTRKEIAEYALTLKAMTDEQLFETWSHEYDARHTEHVALIIAEMDVRKLNGEAIKL
jgi:hypothetical protein